MSVRYLITVWFKFSLVGLVLTLLEAIVCGAFALRYGAGVGLLVAQLLNATFAVYLLGRAAWGGTAFLYRRLAL